MPTLHEPSAETEALGPDELAQVFGSHRMFLSTVFDEDLWHMQREIADAVDRHDRVAVKACHASGKTRLGAGVGASFFARHKDAIVISTAPTWTQVEKLLWGEVHALVKKARFVSFPEPLTTELRFDEKNYFIGYSTNEAVRFQGWHAPNVLIILDEAPGIMADIHDALAGIEAGGRVRMLMLGNPVVGSGKFYDAFSGKQRRFWQRFTISAFDTPNLAGCYIDEGRPETRVGMRLPPPPGHAPLNLAEITDENDPRLDYAPRPYLTTRRWVWKRYLEWGVLSAPFQSRVLGKFPDDNPDALIGLGLLEDAEPPAPAREGDALDIGIDVAGPGDNMTVMQTLVGDTRVRVRAWPTGECEGAVIAAIREDEHRTGQRARHVGIDTTGIGHFFANTVQAAGIKVNRINAATAAAGREDQGDGRKRLASLIYQDQNTQRYWRLRRRFREHQIGGLAPLSENDETVSQLASLRIEHTDKGRLAMESKPKRRRRGLESPDYAEALMCAQYLPDLDVAQRPRAVFAGSVSLMD